MNMMNLKNKLTQNRTTLISAAITFSSMASQAICKDELAGKLQGILEMIWTLTTFTGIAMCAIGLVQVIRCVIALTGGDQLQPGQLGKSIGMIGAGICACALKTVLDGLEVQTELK